MNFKDFKIAVEQQLEYMSRYPLFKVNLDHDTLWDTYINAFPEGTNPIFRERTEHDCSCCRSFVRQVGGVVAIIGNEIVTAWDITNVEEGYQAVAATMSETVKGAGIASAWFSDESAIGTDHNFEVLDNGTSKQWDHFRFEIPNQHVVSKDDLGTKISEINSTYDVFKRGMEELTMDALEIVQDLIDQNSLYRGEEFKAQLAAYHKLMKGYHELTDNLTKENYARTQARKSDGIARLRNTAIGTLLIDLSEGMDIENAVKKYEVVMAPANYKRPTALITKSMIRKAQDTVEELGLTDALPRRYADISDITINNILWANRDAKKSMNVFDDLVDSTPEDIRKFDKIEEIGIDTFINEVLPQVDSVQMYLDNSHTNRLVSLIAPVNNDSGNLFKWNNNFSWAYKGDVTDSIKEKVKQAGGDIDGVIRCSLSWFNTDDLDIHIIEPKKNRICFNSKRNPNTTGKLDVDMNVNELVTDPVENITWTNENKMEEGLYQLLVHNYTKRNTANVGFDVEVECDGEITRFHYNQAVPNQKYVEVCTFKWSRNAGLEIIKSIPSTKASVEVFSIPTQTFHDVTVVMNSPNHWDGEETGNKHWFFMLKNCVNPEQSRGFFNEFLKQDFNQHRKVFEVLGNKMKTPETDKQLSGLGFSSTQRENVIVKVTGSFSRTLKVNF